jgi:fructose-bisphosphate aldolase class I
MIYAYQVFVTILLVLVFTGEAFHMPVSGVYGSSLKMALSDYREELAATAAKISGPGKGILAVDESTKTIGKRLESIGVENTEANRLAYRGLLFSAPGLGKYISGAILYEETLYQSEGGKSFVDILKANDIFPGIKVDTGLQPLPGGESFETW